MNNDSIKEMDSNILLSIINLKLRDYYSNLNLLCDDMSLDKELIIKKLAEIDYEYKEELNQFK